MEEEELDGEGVDNGGGGGGDDNDKSRYREQDFADTWIQRASSFNNVCNRFSKLCDKFTFIPNRELFFDINSYLSNLQESYPLTSRLSDI